MWQNAGIPKSEIEIVSEIDHARIGCAKMLKRLVAKAKGNLICFVGDDCIPQEGFLYHALEAMKSLPDSWGMVGIDDNLRRRSQVLIAGHWLADRRLLPLLPDGEFFHTSYWHAFCDWELFDRVSTLGRYTFCEKAYIHHDHQKTLHQRPDEDSLRVWSHRYQVHDLGLYRHRKRLLNPIKNYRGGRFLLVRYLRDRQKGEVQEILFTTDDLRLAIQGARNLVRGGLQNHLVDILQFYPSSKTFFSVKTPFLAYSGCDWMRWKKPMATHAGV
jgi:hypothetical protein